MHLRTIAFALIVAITVSADLINPSTARRIPYLSPDDARQLQIPAPSEVLGFTPGDDRKLASWNQVVEYFNKLDKASERVRFEVLGETTMDRPFVMATISAPENLARLDEYKKIQELLADPRKLGPNPDRRAAQLIARGKTIVLITCGIHSTEVGSYLSSMLIAHRLASSDEPEIQNILKNTIILLVPSLNPDGVDIVKNWYDKTLGTPYEGTDPPELYHKYTGHDNNRDWYAFTQVETQITVDKIHNVWHPQIVHDIHQQGAFGSRLFLPPYMQPVEPNVPNQIREGYTELGNFMAREMRAQGFKGITTNSTYDAWSPSRAYSHYHGGVRMLSETASCKLATPITVKFDELRSREGYDPQKESANFGPLWRGGEWHLRDITNYMTTGAFLLLKNASQNRLQWLRRFYEIGKEAVRPRRDGELFAFLLPARGKDVISDGGVLKSNGYAFRLDSLRRILERAGIEVDEAKPFAAWGNSYPDHTLVVRLRQPYAAFARALLQPQIYPDLRDSSNHPIAPYDVTAHTLSLLMGLDVRTASSPINYQRYPAPDPDVPPYSLGCSVVTRTAIYKSHAPVIDFGWSQWVFADKSWGVHPIDDKTIRENLSSPNAFKVIVIPDQPSRTTLNGYAKGTMPPEYTGGLGLQGVEALREFVEKGGTLVCLNRASDFAIEQFKLPLKNVVAGLPRTDFYVPGSILRIELDTAHSLAAGMPKDSIAWAEDSPVFEVVQTANANQQVNASNVSVVAWYPRDKNPLLSGWLLGADRIKGKAALVEVAMGKGRIILFGFRPQYRGQSLATYPLFFNAIAGK